MLEAVVQNKNGTSWGQAALRIAVGSKSELDEFFQHLRTVESMKEFDFAPRQTPTLPFSRVVGIGVGGHAFLFMWLWS